MVHRLRQVMDRNSLRFRLQTLIILACFPAVCVAVYSGMENRKLEVARVQNDVLQLVTVAAREQEDLINRNTPPLLRLLATLYPEVHAQDGARTSALFARILSEYPQYINIMAAKVPGGEVFASGIPLTRPVNLSDRSYFARTIQNADYTVGEYALGRGTGRPTLVCCYPVVNNRGKVTAVIMAGLDLEGFARHVADAKQNKDAVVTVLDRNGRVLCTTNDHNDTVGRDITGSSLWRAIGSASDGSAIRSIDLSGEPSLMAFKVLAGATGKGDAFMVAGIPEEVAFSAADRSMKKNLVGILLSTILAMAGTMLFAHRSILRKVDSLMIAALQVGEGKLGAVTGLPHGHDEFGKLAYAFDMMSRNLQEREEAKRKAEEALLDEKERLMVTLRSIGDGVITTDNAGRITLLNTVAESLTGWTLEEAVGRPLGEVFRIINEETRLPCVNPVDLVLETGRIVELANHTALITRGGDERIIADSGAPIVDKNDKIIGVVLVFRDITEKQRMEDEVIKVEKLESLGLLAGGIAHDFNNLLTAILGNIALARLVQPEAAPERLQEAEKASLRARDLTRQLLTFARGGEPLRKTMKIEGLITDNVRFVLSGSSVGCDFFLPTDLWPVDVDEGQFTQVISNLAINALQAMPDGGTMTVRAGNCTIPPEDPLPLRPGDYVKVVFEDQGHGIAEDHLEKIFDPYFTTKKTGQGLGLASAFHILKRHDGYITADSSPGAGATFSFYLPASQGNVIAAVEDTVHVSGKGTVLVMDDEEMVRMVTGEMLAQLGYQVEYATDGKEAIDLYRESMAAGAPYAAIIMDLTVPGGMGGRDALAHLVKIDPGIRAIASSGYSDDALMADYRQHGFRGVIPKPYVLDELKQALREAAV